MENIEQLGEFYLGRVVDETSLESTDQLYLLDSKDLTTHGMIVGMTGSGKTGLAINLLEEAAMDNLPALVIDPKGDMSNLLLNFPDFKGEDFLPWIDPAQAQASGQSSEDFAAGVAENWKKGLEGSGITSQRLRDFKDKVDIAIYTPGSNAGRPLSILDFADKPSQEVLEDREALNDQATSTVSSLLALIGIEADPLNSPDHILLSTILLDRWSKGENVTLSKLIQTIQDPGIETVGVLPLDSFYPRDKRNDLAMKFNNLIASPNFASWFEGESLNVQNLLYTPEGKPRISILSINHLEEKDRIFIVSTILNKVVSWLRSQSGTSSLRALLYMDEIFGYFPPVSNPPTKKPLLTLLKQARAYGVGVVLATQNPSDLDYKGLSNIGTWFIGRLQTEQDKNRLMEGLKSANNEGREIPSDILSELISKLPKRSFLVNNVHEEGPELFTTRWAMSYLAGPLTRNQIKLLNDQVESPPIITNQIPSEVNSFEEGQVIPTINSQQAAQEVQGNPKASALRPEIPEGIPQYYLKGDKRGDVLYRASLYGMVTTTYEDKKLNLSQEENTIWNTFIEEGVLAVDWSKNTGILVEPEDLQEQASPHATYINVPSAATKKSSYTQWEKDLVDYIYKNKKWILYENEINGLTSKPGESQQEFQLRTEQSLREARDEAIVKLKEDYNKKLTQLEGKILKAEERVAREEGQANQARMNTVINMGSTILDSFLGKKRFGRTTASKAASSMRAAGRARQKSADVDIAMENLQVLQEEYKALEENLQQDLITLTEKYSQGTGLVKEVPVAPLKKNINVRAFSILWLPYAENVEEGTGSL